MMSEPRYHQQLRLTDEIGPFIYDLVRSWFIGLYQPLEGRTIVDYILLLVYRVHD